MKRTAIGLVVVLLGLLFSSSAMADERFLPLNGKQKVKDKTGNSKVPYIAALPAYYFLVQVPLHESSHALLAGLNPNWEARKFRPFPHLNENNSLVFGSVDMRCYSVEACGDKTGLGVIALAPYVTATTIFMVSDAVLSTGVVNPASTTGRVLYFAGMAMPWWDFFFNSVWAVNPSDAAAIANSFEIPRWSVVATGIGISAVGVWRLWVNGKRAFPGQNHDQAKESNLVIVPMGDSGTIGASAILRF